MGETGRDERHLMPAEPDPAPRVLLMGIGAIGGAIAAGLLASGDDVTLVTHNAEISNALATQGLRLTRPEGEQVLPATMCADTCPDLSSAGGPFDIALLAMKATAAKIAAREVWPLLSPDGYVVTLQNGIVEDRVAEIVLPKIVGRDHVIGALVGWGATMHRPGIYEMTSRGETTIGELDGGVTRPDYPTQGPPRPRSTYDGDSQHLRRPLVQAGHQSA